MPARRSRLSVLVMEELEQCDYELEFGSKHIKIRVYGKFIGVYPYDSHGAESNSRSDLNIRACIRRRVAEWKAEQCTK